MKKISYFGFYCFAVTVSCVLAAQQRAAVDRPSEPNFALTMTAARLQIVPPDFSVAGNKNIPRRPGHGFSPAG